VREDATDQFGRDPSPTAASVIAATRSGRWTVSAVSGSPTAPALATGTTAVRARRDLRLALVGSLEQQARPCAVGLHEDRPSCAAPIVVDNSWVVPPIPVVALALRDQSERERLGASPRLGVSRWFVSLARRDLVERGDGRASVTRTAATSRSKIGIRTVAVSTARSRRSASA